MPPAPEGRIVLAPAKINLALHVVGRRGDGFHALDTIAVFADLGDTLGILPATDISLRVEGRFAAHAPAGAENLVLEAARRLAAAMPAAPGSRGALLTLHKDIPAGSGFGGGSADAAAALRLLAGLWHGGADEATLVEIAAEIGADVPMCLSGKALRARGRGERIAPIRGWPALPLVLVWPGVSVSTANVFASLEQRENASLPDPGAARTPEAVAEYLAGCRNDLEPAATAVAPVIGDALRRLRETDCLFARMSGSGSGCFGLYRTPEAADAAVAALAVAEPGWWVRRVLAH